MAKAKSSNGKTGKDRERERPFPSKEEVLEFIAESPGPVGRREIARAFGLRGGDRPALTALLKEIKRKGRVARPAGGKTERPDRLPPVAVLQVSHLDEDGELIARPAAWDESTGTPPVIYLAPEKRSRSALAIGDRVLARLSRSADGTYEARPIRQLGRAPDRVLGVYERSDSGGRLRPTDKRAKREFAVRAEDAHGARPGELVLAEPKPGRARLGLQEVRVIERLGEAGDPRSLSLIAIHEHGLPTVFADEAQAAAAAAGPAPLGKRRDLRALPLVTIDGADARDFDDAVWAEPDADPKNPGGWHLLVAIADVAWYVRPGSALDRAAAERGNSAYFPDRVVPMLPEALSNGWCSLRPGEERPCLVAELWIDAAGRTRRHRFRRGLMRSAARLTYEQVQNARDGRTDETTAPLLESVIAPLYGAFAALLAAREARGTLDLELPERQVLLDGAGRVTKIVPRRRLDSHRLIEEFMIAANVAAARELERLRQPCMYRVHASPDPVKIEALRQILESLELRLARGQVIRPGDLTRILHQVRDAPAAQMVNELILRAQSQAVYSPENLGHYGLALTHYAHFTSPIRRYADLLVHRALIRGLALGEGPLDPDSEARFAEIGEQISMTERRAAAAERDAVDRFTAAFLQDRVGAEFDGAINGVTRFGLFITLDETGADGLVPISRLPDDYYDHDAARHRLVGRRWGRSYHLGELVRVRLCEAEPMTGGLIFDLVERGETEPARETRADSARPQRRGRPPLDAEIGAPRAGKQHRRANGRRAKSARRTRKTRP